MHLEQKLKRDELQDLEDQTKFENSDVNVPNAAESSSSSSSGKESTLVAPKSLQVVQCFKLGDGKKIQGQGLLAGQHLFQMPDGAFKISKDKKMVD